MKRYKVTILILSIIVIIESLLLITLLIRKPKKIPRPLVYKGKIAIVIDDWGYNANNLQIVEQIKYPLTISILPNLNYSRALARQLYKYGFQIILHLPMEPHEKFRLEQNTIMTSMDEATIKNIINQDLMSLPNTQGVSNHMGSKATEDLKTMEIIFKELKRRQLYFLDSVVSSESVGFDLANKMHLRFAKRDIFLDNEEDPLYIKAQIYKLKIRARVYGQAIGVGHDRRITLEVLKEVMPMIEKEGYRFVFVSELVK